MTRLKEPDRPQPKEGSTPRPYISAQLGNLVVPLYQETRCSGTPGLASGKKAKVEKFSTFAQDSENVQVHTFANVIAQIGRACGRLNAMRWVHRDGYIEGFTKLCILK